MKQAVELFKNRQIPTVQTSRKAIDMLASKSKKTNLKGLERLAQYEATATATGRLIKTNKLQTYYVKGSIHVMTKYS